MKRRDFLKATVAATVGTAALPQVFGRVASVMAADTPPASPAGRRVLVVVQMAGGNDGLNTVVPYAQGRYHDVRPALALADSSILPLDSNVAFHSSLASLKELWDQGVLAVVQGVGYPRPSLSHFESMDVWRFADPQRRVFDGWLGRYLDGIGAAKATTFPALAVGSSLPPELRSPVVTVPTVESVAAYRLVTEGLDPTAAAKRTQALLNLYQAFPKETPYSLLLQDTFGAANKSIQALQTADQSYKAQAQYPNSSLARGLKLLAEAIVADLGVRVGHVSIGGFDTHAGQAPAQEALLKDVADSLKAFYQDLKAHGRDGEVVIMTWSEFGRRVASNASGGTDHGTASVLFVLGTPVTKGLYGEYPSLTNLDNGNLKFTTDFRRVYATILEQWLGVPSDAVLGGQKFETLGFLSPVRAPAA